MSKLDLLAFNVRHAFDGDKFDRALNWLPKEEHKSVLRYKYDKDRHLGLANLLLRRYYFTKELNVGWNELEFGRLPQGKPYLKHYDSLEYDYNTSHEGDWVIFGCTQKMKIGVDAVAIDRPKGMSIDAFIRSFSPQLVHNELDFIMDHEDEDIRLLTFYQYWGCKESYTKALGVGLILELNQISFMNENQQIKMKFKGEKLDHWYYHISYLDQQTIAVVCSGFTDSKKPVDDNIIKFIKTSELLGEPLHKNGNKDLFDRVTFEDIENNKWMQKD